MDFIEDVYGDNNLLNQETHPDDEIQYTADSPIDDNLTLIVNRIQSLRQNIITEKQIKSTPLNSVEELIESFYKKMQWGENTTKKNHKKYQFDDINMDTGRFDMKAATIEIESTLKKSVFTSEMEKEFSLPEYDISKRRLKKINKKEKAKTKGPNWYNLPAPEITEELKNDLEILKMRSALDPKHFYKNNDMEQLPKYFQVGKVLDSALDHPNERTTRKQRKRTIVDELLSDAEFKKYNKRKYGEILEEKKKSNYKNYIKEKRKKNKAMKKQIKLPKSASKVKNFKLE